MWKNIVRWLLCWPLFLGLIPVGLMTLLWGKALRFENGILISEFKKDSWPMKSWFKNWGGYCAGYAVMLAPNQNPSVLAHELIHVEQLESESVAGIGLGIVSAVIAGGSWGLLSFLLSWLVTPWVCYGAASLVALLRGEKGYWGNHLEEAARNGAEK